jgi:hypothetical protein
LFLLRFPFTLHHSQSQHKMVLQLKVEIRLEWIIVLDLDKMLTWISSSNALKIIRETTNIHARPTANHIM